MNEIAFERRAAAEPKHMELRLLVDGVDLRELAKNIEMPFAAAEGQSSIAGAYSGIQWDERVDPHQIVRHYLGSADPIFTSEGRTQLLACECGEPGCWPLMCRIEASATTVRWSDFLQPHRSGRWSYEGFGPFVFARDRYEAAILDALRGDRRQLR